MPVYLESSNTLWFNQASPNNPDALVIWSRDGNAAAASVIVASVPAVGSSILFQITRSKSPTGPYQFWHTVVVGDTAQSLAQTYANAITANTTLQADGIAGQYVNGTSQFGVSHPADDAITVSAAAWNPNGSQIQIDNGGVFTFSQAGSRLDAGPQYVMTRDPSGWTPTADSNIGQIVAQARVGTSTGPIAQYATQEAYIVSADPANPKGMWTFDTVGLVSGQLSIVRRAAIGQGLAMSDAGGASLADKGPGTIHCKELWVNGVKIA